MTDPDQGEAMRRLGEILRELRAGKHKDQIDLEARTLERPVAQEIEDALNLADDAALESLVIVIVGVFVRKYRMEIHEAMLQVMRERQPTPTEH